MSIIKKINSLTLHRFCIVGIAVLLLLSSIPIDVRADNKMNGYDLHNTILSNLDTLKKAPAATRIATFVWNVREGGKWDYKVKLGYNTEYYCMLGDVFVKMTGEEIGNFHYGVVGSMLFDSETLKSAGGLVQIATNSKHNKKLDFSSCDLDSYCDQPEDTEAIQRGIDIYNGKSVSEVFGDRINKDIVNVTYDFAKKTVRIKSIISGEYVSIDSDANACAGGQTKAGVFTTTITSDGWIGFKQQDGKWLSVRDGGYLKTVGEKLKAWECFRIYKIGEYYYLLSQKDRKFVQVTKEDNRPLKSARAIKSGFSGATWERFAIEII